MAGETLVRVENVSKRFCRSLKRSMLYGLRDMGREMIGRRHGGSRGLPRSSADVQLRQKEFWAVQDVNFEVKRGECLALIGRNGAGKTTLLRMLNGLIKPDTGRIEMRGRVGALIALGAGFNPLLTGRENIRVNASLLGLSKREIEQKIEEIVEFAEIGEFIDAPVRSYSSGMNVRLGFATASTLNPDILIIDEVLAVGDNGFQIKCLNRIQELLTSAAVLFVTHSMPFVAKICTHGLAMQPGQPTALMKNTSDAIEWYFALFNAGKQREYGNGKVKVSNITLEDDTGNSISKAVPVGSRITLSFCMACNFPPETLLVGLSLSTQDQRQLIHYLNEDMKPWSVKSSTNKQSLRFTTEPLLLRAGTYQFTISVSSLSPECCHLRLDSAATFIISESWPTGCDILNKVSLKVCSLS